MILYESYDLSSAAHERLVVYALYVVRCDFTHTCYGVAADVEYVSNLMIHDQDLMARNGTNHMVILIGFTAADTEDLPAI